MACSMAYPQWHALDGMPDGMLDGRPDGRPDGMLDGIPFLLNRVSFPRLFFFLTSFLCPIP